MKLNSKSKIEGLLYRADLAVDGIDEDNRTLTVSFSSEQPYKRVSYFDDPWIEVLGHKKNEVNLDRLNNAAPVLYNHERGEKTSRLGVVTKAWIDGERGHATVKISKRDEISQIWQDIKDGILKNISVGYQILERNLIKENKDGINEYRVTKWMPMEVSFVDVPADYTVGVGRSDNYQIIQLSEDKRMDGVENLDVAGGAPNAGNESIVIDGNPEGDEKRNDGSEPFERSFQVAETKRRKEVREILKPFAKDHPDVVERCLDDLTITPQQASQIMLKKLGSTHSPSTQIVRDETETRMEGMNEYLLFRAMPSKEKMTDKARLYNGFSLYDMAREFVPGHRGLSKNEVFNRALSTSDFPKLLANMANKTLRASYEEMPKTYEAFTTVGTTSDFKPVTRATLSNMPDLKLKHEGDEYEWASLADGGESYKIATYGRILRFTREALINDDINAFTRLASKYASSASRLESDLAWGQLTSTANMSDGFPLFHANHNNLVGTGTAISVASMSQMKTMLRMQKSADGSAMGLSPTLLLVPVAKETEAMQFVNATSIVYTKAADFNPFAGTLQVVSDPRLDAVSATAWYLAADKSVVDLIELSYLDGAQGIYTEENNHFATDDWQIKARLDVGAKALDYRGFVKNPGA